LDFFRKPAKGALCSNANAGAAASEKQLAHHGFAHGTVWYAKLRGRHNSIWFASTRNRKRLLAALAFGFPHWFC